MNPYLITGILLGVSAGFAPGPLLTLVISETMRHGSLAGIRVALAPLLTDLPIIIVSLFILAKFSGSGRVLGGFSLVGGLFVLYLAYENFRVKAVAVEGSAGESRSLAKGVLVNFLSPHPYLFWISVGAPMVIKASANGFYTPIVFVFVFYLMLVGSKITLAILAGRSRSFLTGGNYVFVMRFIGVLLCVLAFFLVKDGLQFLGIPILS